MGKAYANKTPMDQHPDSDYYCTPKSLVWKLLDLCIIQNSSIYEPACGEGAISSVLKERGFNVIEDDIRTTGKDFLLCEKHYPWIMTNPPFSLFDEFVIKAKQCSDQFIFLAKTNFFGAYQRYEKGIWKNLKSVYIFNRQVDYRTPMREDGLFHVGNLITGWFHWDKNWNENYWRTSIIDVQSYAKLGQYHEKE
jgi:hypothetical protein